MDARTSQTSIAARSHAVTTRVATGSWLILIGLTLAMLGAGQVRLSGAGIVALLLAATLVKTALVAEVFMGLRHSRLLWRMIVAAYLVIVIGLIGLAWWLGNA